MEPGSTCGILSSAETTPGTIVLDPARNTTKRYIITKCNEWKMAIVNEWLGINKGRKWLTCSVN
jgi:hypothetical protein